MKRDQLNDQYIHLVDKQRLYFKTVKDFKEVLALSKFYFSVHKKQDVISQINKTSKDSIFSIVKQNSIFPSGVLWWNRSHECLADQL